MSDAELSPSSRKAAPPPAKKKASRSAPIVSDNDEEAPAPPPPKKKQKEAKDEAAVVAAVDEKEDEVVEEKKEKKEKKATKAPKAEEEEEEAGEEEPKAAKSKTKKKATAAPVASEAPDDDEDEQEGNADMTELNGTFSDDEVPVTFSGSKEAKAQVFAWGGAERRPKPTAVANANGKPIKPPRCGGWTWKALPPKWKAMADDHGTPEEIAAVFNKWIKYSDFDVPLIPEILAAVGTRMMRTPTDGTPPQSPEFVVGLFVLEARRYNQMHYMMLISPMSKGSPSVGTSQRDPKTVLRFNQWAIREIMSAHTLHKAPFVPEKKAKTKPVCWFSGPGQQITKSVEILLFERCRYAGPSVAVGAAAAPPTTTDEIKEAKKRPTGGILPSVEFRVTCSKHLRPAFNRLMLMNNIMVFILGEYQKALNRRKDAQDAAKAADEQCTSWTPELFAVDILRRCTKYSDGYNACEACVMEVFSGPQFIDAA